KKEGTRIMIRIQRASDLLHLDDVLGESEDYEHIKPVYYVTDNSWRSSDFHYIVEQLGEREAHVVLNPKIGRLPYTSNRYNLFDALTDAGCHVAALPERDAVFAFKQLRHRMAQVVRGGLSREDAIKGMTQHAADAVGAGMKIGSLEKDKDGDLAFFNGDPLDPTSKVTRVMIHGEIVWEAEDQK
ncbi:MAG: amidohydrolase family protein, partial [Phycisphaerae bacterium]